MRLVEEILQSPPKEKEILIDGLMAKGDLVAFGGRRKNGKTTLLFNLAFALASGQKDFLGFKISRAAKVLFVLLEDPEANVRSKLEQYYPLMPTNERLGIIDKGVLKADSIRNISVDDPIFASYIKSRVQRFTPDVLIIDNLSHLVRGQYNAPEMVDKAVVLAQELGQEGCSVIVAMHPRKKSPDDEDNKIIVDTEGFFEDLMGSSHFINSADCLWGIKLKDKDSRTSNFVGGMQRFTGEEHHVIVELDDDDMVRLVEDMRERELFLLNTKRRKLAWQELGSGPWTAADAQKLVKQFSRQAFYGWWNDLVRQQLVILADETGENWRKA